MDRLNEKFLPKLDIFKEIFNGNSVCLYGEGYGAKSNQVVVSIVKTRILSCSMSK